jgi:CHAD domain-containing protein
MASPTDRTSYELRRDEGVGEGLTRSAAARAEKALERLREIQAGEADRAKAIHAARKDLKKARTVLRLSRPGQPVRLYKDTGRHLRDAGRALSASRDAEVRLATLTALAERAELPVAAVASWRAILERDRDAALDTTAEARAIEEAAEAVGAGLAEIERWELGGGWKLLGAGVARFHRRGRRAMRRAAAKPSEETFHEWRKRAKDSWYALKLMRATWPRPLEAEAEEAHALSELLGDHHDLAVLRADLEERNLDPEATAALGQAIAARQEELAAAAFPLGERLYAERPKALRRRLRGYWRAWRG